MKQVIANIEYNTETAVLIDTWKNNYPDDHPKAWSDTLYRTKDGGHPFLLCKGNADTSYSQGEKIMPLDGHSQAIFYWRKYGLFVNVVV
jgi:hypothetical protein